MPLEQSKVVSPNVLNSHAAALDPPPQGRPRPRKASTPSKGPDGEDAAWGSNFWVTLVDPQTQTSFFACPATGQVSWDPPVGNFVLPPSEAGEWWELLDESRGLPYYYQTKTGETVWERPQGFVIPLGIIQNTALARRLSQTRFSRCLPESDLAINGITSGIFNTRGAKEIDTRARQDQSSPLLNGSKRPIQRSRSGDPKVHVPHIKSHVRPQTLTPIPGSDASLPPSISRRKSQSSGSPTGILSSPEPSKSGAESNDKRVDSTDSNARARTLSSPYRPQKPQSLNAALEQLTVTTSDSGNSSSPKSPTVGSPNSSPTNFRGVPVIIEPTTSTRTKLKRNGPTSPRAPPNASRSISAPTLTVDGKVISSPIPNYAATLELSPIKDRSNEKPIPVHPKMNATIQRPPAALVSVSSLPSGTYPVLPADLATDIQQFAESEFARQYFSTHKTGFIFKRKVPVSQMMTWQKSPLTSPLLTLNRLLNKDAIKVFRVVQCLMGDRDREKPPVRLQSEPNSPISAGSSTPSLLGNIMLEEERWLLGEGLTHGELRDEIYCQLMKQLTGNPNTESIFKGWQLLCVLLITFPPSKNFETYLCSFIQQHTNQQEGRVDIMAKYCMRRLLYISRKGPRGKTPSLAEIEAASDAAFHPSTFGESLDAILRLQERKYPQQRVPIILPFLANGILALGGPKAEGIFRVPGDADSVAELKLRIDRGYYTTDGINDPHVLASLMKLWLRELCDPLIPDELYNECIMNAQDGEACVRIVERLPTINRRVILFVISFLQLFLEEKVQNATKMTPANLALVMAPNILRCGSDSMTVVFTNAQYEQIFIYNLLLKLQCGQVDLDYIPAHGLEAADLTAQPRASKSRSRRPV